MIQEPQGWSTLMYDFIVHWSSHINNRYQVTYAMSILFLAPMNALHSSELN